MTAAAKSFGSSGSLTMFRYVLLAAIAAAVLAGCGKRPEGADKGGGAASAQPLLLASADLLTVRNSTLASGPLITGTLQPERRADLRAEVPAVVLQVLKENGDPVRRGDLLVRLDDTAIRDSLMSAEAAARAAGQAHDQAQAQLARMTTLRKSGMVSTQSLEDAEIRRNTTQSDLVAAKARVAQARQQLQRTETRAPFNGIVSDRKVSAGDTAQVGKELLKVIDPGSLRFEGLVSADHIGEVKVGQAVAFRVNGYGEQDFTGRVARLNPAANATTRQVEVLVEFADGQQQPKLAGLYAEGRVEASRAVGLTLPASALVREGDRAYAWRLRGQALEKVGLVVGERDPRSGEFVLKGGLAEGDRLIRHPSTSLRDGQKVELAAAPGSTGEQAAAPSPTVKR